MKSPVLPTKGKIMLYLSMLKTMLQIKQILVTLPYYVNQNLLLELLSLSLGLSASDSGRAVARAVPDGDLRRLYLVRPLPQTPWRNPAAVSGHKVFTHAFAEGYDASLRSATRPTSPTPYRGADLVQVACALPGAGAGLCLRRGAAGSPAHAAASARETLLVTSAPSPAFASLRSQESLEVVPEPTCPCDSVKFCAR